MSNLPSVKDMIIECPSCGFNLSSDAVRCHRCGAELGLAGINDLVDLAKVIQNASGPEDIPNVVEPHADGDSPGEVENDPTSSSASGAEDTGMPESTDDDVPGSDADVMEGDGVEEASPDETDEEVDTQPRKRRFRLFGR